MAKTMIMDHPMIQHKIGVIRRKETGTKDFRILVSEIAMLMCYEATRDLELSEIEIDTPICKAKVKELKGSGNIKTGGILLQTAGRLREP